MGRSTDGRRRNRAGSITVAELVRRQPKAARARLRIESPWEHAPAHSDPPEAVASDQEEPGALFRTTPLRTLAFVAGLLVLSSSILATGMITNAPRVDLPGGADLSPITLAGPLVMRPDVLTAYLARPEISPQPLAVIEDSDDAADATQPLGDRVPPGQQRVVAGGPATVYTDRELVEQFFTLLDDNPTAAASLLAPELRGGDRSDFIEAWDDVHGVEVVTIDERQAGSVVATVAIDGANGGRLYLTHQLVVGDTPKRITEARLLGAQQSETHQG
ncbi:MULTISPECIES: hypothetical protein [Actinoalloteichus]|uniref:Uncharacterized protein n=1 Tax=Actinoalloteichus fjordicus TaxID=1612552 RepID=A0AAC9PUT9_9PSEU|nr:MULTISPECIES: hypothetical protein [Actinoalloteichus]APU17558.1 hypothetical protein UA74_27785 [Actinoalloteichus fjordicus]APU23636.1 hypothetical protein UA75_28325 [Actinoalloteichus sp. GBA129-24]